MQGLLVVLLAVPACLGVNRIEQPGTMGPDVVTTVVEIIRSHCILANDKLFLRRLAYVETRDGSLPIAYANPSFDGGIWQVTQKMFLDTQRGQHVLTPLYQIIKNKLHIDWLNVHWKDLRKPLYSGLAAALFLTLHNSQTSTQIPLKVEEQATFWQDTYHRGGQPYNYTHIVTELQLGCQISNREVDLAFVVDSSSSLSQDDFQRMIYFLNDVVTGLNIGYSATRVAVVTYASTAQVQFNLDQHFTLSEVKRAISQLNYASGGTNTAQALNVTRTQVFDRKGRSNVIKVIVLVTDGISDDRINTNHASQYVHADRIVVFTVGIGSQVATSELESVASTPKCTHVFSANSYDSVTNLVQEIQNSICRAPLYVNETVTCEIGKCPPYGFYFNGNSGITIKSHVNCGASNLFADINNFYPSTAHNIVQELIRQNETAFYQPRPDSSVKFLYITVNNQYGSNGCNITLTPYIGDQTVKVVQVFCRDLPTPHERECKKNDLIQFRPLICEGPGKIHNPCTHDDAINQKRYPLPGTNIGYIQCQLNGGIHVAYCTTGDIFDPVCLTCYGKSSPKVDCSGVVYPGNNTCTAQNLLAGHYFFAYPGNHNKYIQCDNWGKPWVRDCEFGYLWVQTHLTCEKPGSSYNPCPEMKVNGNRFFAYPYNIHFFIECLDTLNPVIMKCPDGDMEGWDDCVKTCVPMNRLSCVNATIPPRDVPLPAVQDVDDGAFQYPCTREHLANSKYYFPVHGNKHQFIQCAPSGIAYVKDCPGSDCFDPNSNTCVDGCVIIDGLVGRK